VSRLSAPAAVRSAFRAGGLAGVIVRPSRHATSGVVLVCCFADTSRARSFARRWAARLGRSVVVRPFARPGRLLWSVSIPVAGAIPFAGVSSLPAGAPWVADAWRLAGVRSVPAVARAVARALL